MRPIAFWLFALVIIGGPAELTAQAPADREPALLPPATTVLRSVEAGSRHGGLRDPGSLRAEGEAGSFALGALVGGGVGLLVALESDGYPIPILAGAAIGGILFYQLGIGAGFRPWPGPRGWDQASRRRTRTMAFGAQDADDRGSFWAGFFMGGVAAGMVSKAILDSRYDHADYNGLFAYGLFAPLGALTGGLLTWSLGVG